MIENSKMTSLVRLGLAAQEPFNREITIAANRQLKLDEREAFHTR